MVSFGSYYQINITVSEPSQHAKLNALATLIQPVITYGSIKVLISVHNPSNNKVIDPTFPATLDDVHHLVDDAFKGIIFFAQLFLPKNYFYY